MGSINLIHTLFSVSPSLFLHHPRQCHSGHSHIANSVPKRRRFSFSGRSGRFSSPVALASSGPIINSVPVRIETCNVVILIFFFLCMHILICCVGGFCFSVGMGHIELLISWRRRKICMLWKPPPLLTKVSGTTNSLVWLSLCWVILLFIG